MIRVCYEPVAEVEEERADESNEEEDDDDDHGYDLDLRQVEAEVRPLWGQVCNGIFEIGRNVKREANCLFL